MKKLLVCFTFLFIFFIFPKNVLATTVTNREDGTFLLNGQSFFPIGFWPQALVTQVPLTDWIDLKNSGFNFSKDNQVLGDFNNINQKLRQAGLYVVIHAYGRRDTPQDQAVPILNTANSADNFLGYYAWDEPPIDGVGEYRSGQWASPFPFYQYLFENDPNHFIWTNYYPLYSRTMNDYDLDFFKATDKWGILSRSSVIGADVYTETWANMGASVRIYLDRNKEIIPELRNVRPNINGGIMMIVSGYAKLWGVPLSYAARLGNTIDAIVNGANGLLFYTDNADYIFDNYYEPGVAKPWWGTEANWLKYKNSSVYSEIKQITSILKTAYPGLTGTVNSSITVKPNSQGVRILAKNGTDGKLYIFAANENADNDIQTGFLGLPAGSYTEITQNYPTDANGLSSFNFPKYSVRVYVQGSSTTTLPIPSPTSSPRSLSCQSAVASKTILSSGQSLTITATAKTADIKKFNFAFYNLDNLNSPNNPNGIYFSNLTTQYSIVKDSIIPTNTAIATVNFADLDKPDLNWGNKHPTKIQVNVYFVDTQDRVSASDGNCVVQFQLNTSSTILPGDFDGNKQLDIYDVMAMLSKWLQPTVTLTGIDLKYDLVGSDSKLTINDVVYLLGLWKTAIVK